MTQSWYFHIIQYFLISDVSVLFPLFGHNYSFIIKMFQQLNHLLNVFWNQYCSTSSCSRQQSHSHVFTFFRYVWIMPETPLHKSVCAHDYPDSCRCTVLFAKPVRPVHQSHSSKPTVFPDVTIPSCCCSIQNFKLLNVRNKQRLII